ncbi:hypothetical protein E2C01_062095 [Portunus trituberculatus]|uniref:Uncharacterized protein n=1 Tax=Portunus trituberculatus TaxID=210409 RepID=A0A5B7HDM0_PORTR|nr:hypothetical protein [Portunus trituberculatus]
MKLRPIARYARPHAPASCWCLARVCSSRAHPPAPGSDRVCGVSSGRWAPENAVSSESHGGGDHATRTEGRGFHSAAAAGVAEAGDGVETCLAKTMTIA